MKIKNLSSDSVTLDSLPVGSIFKFIELTDINKIFPCANESEKDKVELELLESNINSIFIKIKPVKDVTTNYFYNCINLLNGKPLFLPTCNSLCIPYDKENFKFSFNFVNFTISNPLSINDTINTRGFYFNTQASKFDSLTNGSLFTRSSSNAKIDNSYFKPFTAYFFIKVNEFKYNTISKYGRNELTCNALCLNFNDVNVRDGVNENFTFFSPDTEIIKLNDICTLDIGK